jgi:hypothetical protein
MTEMHITKPHRVKKQETVGKDRATIRQVLSSGATPLISGPHVLGRSGWPTGHNGVDPDAMAWDLADYATTWPKPEPEQSTRASTASRHAVGFPPPVNNRRCNEVLRASPASRGDIREKS